MSSIGRGEAFMILVSFQQLESVRHTRELLG